MATPTQSLLIIDDTRDEFFKFAAGSTQTTTLPFYYQSTAHVAGTPTNGDDTIFVEILFQGTSIAIFGNTSDPQAPQSEQFTVVIDGGSPFTATYGDPHPPSYRQWYQSPSLGGGLHNITLSNVLGASIDFAVVTSSASLDLIAHTAQTIVVDDDDPAIQYSGSGWKTSQDTFMLSSLQSNNLVVPFGNATHQTSNVGDGFSFNFTASGETGMTVYGVFDWTRLGSLNLTFTVDGSDPQPMSWFVLPEDENFIQGLTEPNNPFFTLPGDLPAGNHSLVVEVTACQNQTFILDYITYTPTQSTLEPVVTSTAVPFSGTGIPASAAHRKTHVGAIAGGVVGGIVFLAIVGLLLGVWRRQRRRQVRSDIMYPFRYGVLWNKLRTAPIPLSSIPQPGETAKMN